ncbi:MAG TPA: HAD family phosphatase [Acidimicrobiales bacterium]|nr:HAD family phosphatase [Acidimicrobiales bacterium]
MSGPAVPAVEAVVFDIGGVLLDWDPRHLYRKVFDDEDAMEHFLGRICTPEWHAPHDRGASIADSCARLAAAHPEHADEIWAWMTRSEEMVVGAIEESVEILGELHRDRTACYALSNMEAETFPGRRERFGFFGLFDGIVISGVEGVAKPDPAIFETLIRRFQLDPRSTLFVDDNADNLASASALGMRSVLFESAGALRRALQELDLLPDGPGERRPG